MVTHVTSGDRMQICKRLVKEFYQLFIAYLVVLPIFKKVVEIFLKVVNRSWIAACKLDLLHAAIHLPLLFVRG